MKHVTRGTARFRRAVFVTGNVRSNRRPVSPRFAWKCKFYDAAREEELSVHGVSRKIDPRTSHGDGSAGRGPYSHANEPLMKKED